MARIEWRLTQSTLQRWRELYAQLELVQEGSDEHLQLLDDIASLPGHPHGYDPDRDLIHFVITTERAYL